MHYEPPHATDADPCPFTFSFQSSVDSTGEPWDVFNDSHDDVRRAWIAFAATIAVCAAVGFTTGVAIAATVGKKVWDAVTAPA